MGLIWDETIEVDEVEQLVREDLSVSPGPILRAIAKRVVREFVEKTFCLVQVVDGEVVIPDGLDPVVGHLEGVEIRSIPGEVALLVEDTPPGGSPPIGRTTDIGNQTWEQYNNSPIARSINIGSQWERAEITSTLLENYCIQDIYIGADGPLSGQGGIRIEIRNNAYVRIPTKIYIPGSAEPFFTGDIENAVPMTFIIDRTTGRGSIIGHATDIEFGFDPNIFSLSSSYISLSLVDYDGIGQELYIPRVASYGTPPPVEVIATTAATPIPWIPSLDATSYPSVLLDWEEYIKAGILSELQMQPNKDWGDPAAATANYRLFQEGIGKAKGKWFRLYGKKGAGRFM